VIDLSRGELATNGTVDERALEAAAAAEVLGLAVRENLGLPDGGLLADDPDQLAALVSAIRRHRPGLLLAPWVEARHPDHAATGHLAKKAVFFAGLRKYRPELGEPFRPRRLLAYPERQDGAPELVVDVSEVYERKLAALACHRSQFGGPESTILTRSLGIEALAVRDRYWGGTIGVRHGEPYLLGGPVPISDPVAHFAAHPASPVWVAR
jgi:bacillithiol biosynthesis deacetylase BshB1